MNRDQQIEEMAKLICTYPQCIHHNIIGECANAECNIVDIAENLYAKGYRKASEIFEEIEKIIDKHYNKHVFGSNDLEDEEREAVINFSDDVTYDIAELKKKYTEEKKDV